MIFHFESGLNSSKHYVHFSKISHKQTAPACNYKLGTVTTVGKGCVKDFSQDAAEVAISAHQVLMRLMNTYNFLGKVSLSLSRFVAVLRLGCPCEAVGLGDEPEDWGVHLVGRPAAAAAGRPGEVGGGPSRRRRRARRRVLQLPDPIL